MYAKYCTPGNTAMQSMYVSPSNMSIRISGVERKTEDCQQICWHLSIINAEYDGVFEKKLDQFSVENKINMTSDKSQNLRNSFTEVPFDLKTLNRPSVNKKKSMNTFLECNEATHVKAGFSFWECYRLRWNCKEVDETQDC